ncbi:hypothetical protein Bbelb_158400 [Branchiostoma belcheri]|nr:hypothetical protein Bbelb_158400 [Branchiostoma belcheri]
MGYKMAMLLGLSGLLMLLMVNQADAGRDNRMVPQEPSALQDLPGSPADERSPERAPWRSGMSRRTFCEKGVLDLNQEDPWDASQLASGETEAFWGLQQRVRTLAFSPERNEEFTLHRLMVGYAGVTAISPPSDFALQCG